MIRTRFSEFRTMVRILAQTAAVLAVAGCVSTQSPDRAAVEIKGSDPAATAPAAPASTVPDARGIVAYDNGIIQGGEATWIHGLTADTDLVREVRMSVLTRTMQEDPQMNGGSGRQGVANRNAAGVADQFRRRLETVRVAPRNLL